MFKQFFMSPFMRFSRVPAFLKVTVTTSILLNLLVNPSFAGDPFRSRNPHNIGDRTEAAFKAIFQQGNYPVAKDYLQKAISSEPNEPLIYAIQASLAYQNGDWTSLDKNSKKTLETAQNLIAIDPLRGNLYSSVGHFLEGAVILRREGTVNGASQAFSRLRKVYMYLDKAESISANDPELNLIRGYMDLMLAVNLPFSSPDDVIQRLQKNAAPSYLVDRGIAIAYRDLKQYPPALDYVNRSLKTTADNPELYYLKAQILYAKGKKEKSQNLIKEAISHFDKALTKKSQLPANLVKQIEHERNQAYAVISQ
ncbi:Sll0314/Alr1548 family TPR repeat-containing protein [Anabaena sp. UHCC 0204]|uniref:Sll0314/Alr1548 family TPR repeat-containing protein n=1 Tax=Anabaena sp. UHCC 0204 TaxID=2590009 RepID=UPI001447BB53|nr:Sll0314/Alr1548 family TPR repeat-containing protein [Anabaena sp. UHCC 0204]MTJ06165.1 tetratricopeptide repeat protein [Anabaena sp. UHCC 0204]